MRSIVVIPARLESSRLPRKVLLELEGKSILQRVYERAVKAKGIDDVYIATDNSEIKQECQKFTSNIVMTSTAHTSGTDRIAEAINTIECDIIVNVQGDEPFIEPALISDIASSLQDSHYSMSSAMHPIRTKEELDNPNVVKVVTNYKDEAIMFSRAVIPYYRDGYTKDTNYFRHIGIYGYTKDFLLLYSKMSPSPLEEVEKLEQLRVLENSYKIKMIQTKHEAFGIDTIEDYNKAIQILRSNNDNN